MQLRILQVTDPEDRKILCRPAQPVTTEIINTKEFKDLIANMKETMQKAPGVGLAAPQIGQPLQVIVIEDCEERQTGLKPEIRLERGREIVPFHVLINPLIRQTTLNRVAFFEGCLSVRGRLRITPRAEAVVVDYFDENGVFKTITARGWYARILQHEIDHLQGKLYLEVGDPRTEIPITHDTVATWINASHHQISLFHTECIIQHQNRANTDAKHTEPKATRKKK